MISIKLEKIGEMCLQRMLMSAKDVRSREFLREERKEKR